MWLCTKACCCLHRRGTRSRLRRHGRDGRSPSRPPTHAGAPEVLLETSVDEAGNQAFPILAGYNAPFTPWFLRRNEIWLALR